jgi:predicted SAM-dependent methyltransferase
MGHPRKRPSFAAFLKERLVDYPKLFHPVRSLYRKRNMPICYVLSRHRIRRYFDTHPCRKIILGAGFQREPGWLATDYYAYDTTPAFLDVRRSFPFDAGSVDYFYTEHMIEHLPYEAARDMLREVFRALRFGGKVRIATPDLDKIIRLKQAELLSPEDRYVTWSNETQLPIRKLNNRASFAINRVLNGYGHQFIYDFQTLSDLLEGVGFQRIYKVEIGESDDPNLRNMEKHSAIVGDEINRVETMVAEAEKP